MKRQTKKQIFQKLLCIAIIAAFLLLAVGSSGPKSADEWNDWLMEMNDMETEAKKDNMCVMCNEKKAMKDKTVCKDCLEEFEELGWAAFD